MDNVRQESRHGSNDTQSSSQSQRSQNKNRVGSIDPSEVKERLNEFGETIARTGSDAYEQVSTIAKDAYSKAFEKGKVGAREVEQRVQQHPFYAIAAAFGLGMLLGSGMKRGYR